MNRLTQIALSLTFVLAFSAAQAQITSYPFVEDFEGFNTFQTNGSCTTPAGINASGWTQMSGDDGDWRADTSGTGSFGTGPGATTTTSGVGVGTDANPGTLSGTYLYTEASNCFGIEVGLISPAFDFSATDSFYRVKLSYHMFGSTMGSLHVDVYDDGTWYNDRWVQNGAAGSSWQVAVIDLAAYNSDSVHIRIRGITGSGFESDICIDNVVVQTFSPPTYDAVMIDTDHNWDVYPIRPLSQMDSVSFWGKIRNDGVKEVTGTVIEVSHGSYSEQIVIDTLAAYDTAAGWVQKQYFPSSVGDLDIQFVVSINENDSFPENDTAYTQISVSDSVYARENSTSTAGLGFANAQGFMGQYLDVINTDTLTSISFFVDGGAGETVRALLFADNAGPASMIESTPIATLTGDPQWYTLGLNCEQVLTPGRYFIVIEQRGDTNIGLSMEPAGYIPNSAFWSVDTSTWNTVESSNFLVCFLLRMNFGEVHFPTVDINIPNDTVCESVTFLMEATGAATYVWSPASYFTNPNLGRQFIGISNHETFTVVGTNACGFSDDASATVYVEKGPSVSVTPDTTVCVGDTVNLQAVTSNAYQWIGGPSNSDWMLPITQDELAIVKVDSSNGCSKSLAVNITASQSSVQGFGDTTTCSGEEIQIWASGADSYAWVNGPADSVYNITVDQTTYYKVMGYNSDGCLAIDSVLVTALQSPELLVTSDTNVCFKDSAYLTATGADSIQWVNGPASSVYGIRVLKSFDYMVEGHNTNGCSAVDTVSITLYFPPEMTLDDDTTICEESSVTLTAGGGDLYEWSTGDHTASIVYSPTEEGYVSVVVANTAGCKVTDSLFVGIDPLPVAAFNFSVDVDSVQLSNTSTDADSYDWDFGDMDGSTDENPYHIYDSSGTYTIMLTATNACGSRDSSLVVEITIPTGTISQNDLRGILEAYPVPTNGLVYLKLNEQVYGAVQLELTDANGRSLWQNEVFKSAGTQQEVIDMTNLAQGAYTLYVRSEEGKYSVKLIRY